MKNYKIIEKHQEKTGTIYKLFFLKDGCLLSQGWGDTISIKPVKYGTIIEQYVGDTITNWFFIPGAEQINFEEE